MVCEPRFESKIARTQSRKTNQYTANFTGPLEIYIASICLARRDKSQKAFCQKNQDLKTVPLLLSSPPGYRNTNIAYMLCRLSFEVGPENIVIIIVERIQKTPYLETILLSSSWVLATSSLLHTHKSRDIYFPFTFSGEHNKSMFLWNPSCRFCFRFHLAHFISRTRPFR